MHKAAREELRIRFKLVVLEHANHFGVTKACQEFNVSRSTFIVGNRNTRTKDDLDCIEKDRSHIAIHARHLLKLLGKSWKSGRSIK